MPEHFHFQQPLWLITLVPMALLAWLLLRSRHGDSDWQRVCESHLAAVLLTLPRQAVHRLPLGLLVTGWLLAALALADPVWQKLPQPVYRSQDAVVIVLSLSPTMLSNDLAPSRLERARYKVAEILKQRKEGLTGLVVYGGDAFTVAPLTSDTRTIQALLKPLQPDLMPVSGARVDLGLHQATALLQQAGMPHGDILLITDGYSEPAALDAAIELQRAGYRLSVLGTGSTQPAPAADSNGAFLRDAQGRVIMPKLETAQLQRLAAAGGGRYSTITENDSDLSLLLPASHAPSASRAQHTQQETDSWKSEGPWLVLALLPLGALAFRRGWLLALPLLVAVTLGNLPQPAMAASWDDLWQRSDQQADRALRAGDAERAQQLAKTPLRQGEAAYRAGHYDAALQAFRGSDTAQGHYNRGNTLAQLGQYQQAIAAYDAALAQEPSLQDARHNKQELEKLLKQQQQQQQQESADQQSSDQGKQSQPGGAGSQDSPQHGAGGQEDKQQPGAGQQQDPDQDKSTENAGETTAAQDTQPAANDTANQPREGSADQAGKSSDDNKPQGGSNQQSAGQPNSGAQQDGADQPQTGKDNAEQAPAQQTAGTEKQQSAEDGGEQPTADTAADSTAPANRATAAATTAATEQQQADERWLRRIPDDPGGLLRRKFLYQYSQRNPPPAAQTN